MKLKTKSITLTLFSFLTLFSTLELSGQIYEELSRETDMTLEEIVIETEKYFDKAGREKGSGYKPFERWRYEAERSLDENGRVKTVGHDMREYWEFVKKNPPMKSISSEYTELGPTSATNTVTWSSALGRFSALGMDINNSNHLIVGSPTGGIWKTTNLGTSWEQLYDYGLDINIWALEISHANSNHYWAGTSSYILRSTNAGESWDIVTSGPNSQVNTIIMDPNDSNILLATERYDNKVWRSSDGGQTWTTVFTAFGDSYDIEFKPGNSNYVYASGAGWVARSTDNGVTWSYLTGPWSTSTSDVLMLAVSAANGDYLYALQEQGSGYNGTFRSTNSGSTWTTQSDNSSGENNILYYWQDEPGGQAPRDMDICINPNNADEVYVAGTELWRSTDGGVNFTQIADWLVSSSLPFIHADVDLLYYNNNALYAGTDGGIFISTDNATSWTDYTAGTGARQFYRLSVSATEVDRVSGGSQDNGTGTRHGNGTWYDWVGADGMETIIDWSDKDIIYANIQYGGLYKTTNGGLSFSSISNSPGGNGSWVTPMEQDPVNSNTIYHAKSEVYKSTNGGGSWTTISAFGHGGGNDCDALRVAPSDNQRIYASWSSNLYRTSNGGGAWTDITPAGAGFINYIDVHPTDPNRVVLAMSGQVWETLNANSATPTWTNITNNLPNITYYCAIYANDGNSGIFAGGRPGIYFIDNSTNSTWINVSMNMPTVQIRELEIKHNSLYVATYGRGMWKATLGSKEGFDCADAIEIDKAGTYTAPGPNHGNGCHNCSGTGVAHANWFEFKPPADGTVTIYSCFAGVDTRLWVYSGDCNTLTQIAASDDDCQAFYGSGNTNASEVINVPVTRAVPIYIEWDERWSESSFFWTIEYDCPPNFEGANALTGTQSMDADFETNGAIESSQTITGSGVNVDYDSGTSIDLLPNFQVNVGAVFEAFIDGCGGSN